MKISVITVCYNAEDTIEKTILSVKNQTYKDIEHIIIDGCSADKTLQIIYKYKENIAIIISEKDNGPYDAMNKGIKKATGDFLIFMNANDTLYDDFVVEKVVNTLKDNPERMILFGDVNRINENMEDSYLEKYDQVKNSFYFVNNNICHQSIFYHKSLFEKFGNYSNNYKIYADWDFNIKCFIEGKALSIYLPITISNFLMGGLCTDSKNKKIYRREKALLSKNHYPKYNCLIILDRFLMKCFKSIYKFIPSSAFYKKLIKLFTFKEKYKLDIKSYRRGDREVKISVLVASYNYENYIKETIDSVIAQTYKNWELIIIDDGSTDDSVNVIKKYCEKDSRISLYQHENNANKGLKETVLLGLEKASTEWIAFLESDDYFEPTYLEEKVKIIEQYSDINLIFNDVKMFGDEEVINNLTTHFEKCHTILRQKPFPRCILKNFNKINMVPSFSVVLVKREALLNCSFDTPIDAQLDWFLWVQMARQDIYYIDKKLTNWRMHPKSYINKINRDLILLPQTKFENAVFGFVYNKPKKTLFVIFNYIRLVFLFLRNFRRDFIRIHLTKKQICILGKWYDIRLKEGKVNQ